MFSFVIWCIFCIFFIFCIFCTFFVFCIFCIFCIDHYCGDDDDYDDEGSGWPAEQLSQCLERFPRDQLARNWIATVLQWPPSSWSSSPPMTTIILIIKSSNDYGHPSHNYSWYNEWWVARRVIWPLPDSKAGSRMGQSSVTPKKINSLSIYSFLVVISVLGTFSWKNKAVLPHLGNLYNFFPTSNSRFESQSRTKNTINTIWYIIHT